MADSPSMTINLIPKVGKLNDSDIESLKVQISDIFKTVTSSDGSASSSLVDDIVSKAKATAKRLGESATTDEEKAQAKTAGERAEKLEKNAQFVKDTEGTGTDKMMMGLMKELGGTLKGFADSTIKFTKEVFGLIEDIYERIKGASPLLQTIEQIFNLVWTLFFMPLGNKLGEMLIPAVGKMMDAVMDIWDKFEGKTLGEMFSIAIREGVKLVASFFTEIGSILQEDTGIVKSIGDVLVGLGKFIETGLPQLIDIGFRIVSFFIDHLGLVIVGVFEAMLASLAIQISLLTTMITNHLSLVAFLAVALDVMSIGQSLAAATVPAVVATTSFTAVEAIGNTIGAKLGVFDAASAAGYAEGGYISPSTGGKLIRVGESGEGEWIIPASKMNALRSGVDLNELGLMTTDTNISNDYGISNSSAIATSNVFNITVNGYTDTDLASKIKSEVNDMVSQSKYRAGF